MALNLCSVIGGNTGEVDCVTKRSVPVKIVAGGKEFSSSDYADAATLQAAVIAATKLATGSASKLYPFPEIKEVEVLTEADTTGSLALGTTKRLRKGRPAYRYSVEISHQEYQKLLAFDGKTVKVFTFDDEHNFWGYRANAAANTPNTNVFKGEDAYVTVSGNGFKDGANASTGVATITVSYTSITDFESRSAYMNLPDLAPGDLVGLKDVMLSQPSAHVSNVYKIKMTIPLPVLGGDLNIYDDYGAAIAALSASWTAFSGATYGTAFTITSIAVDATNKCLTVTMDTTAYAALSSGATFKLIPPTAAQLDAGSAPGIEIGYIILTK